MWLSPLLTCRAQQCPARLAPAPLPLTGLLELLLVIVQGLIVVHADPAHLDPKLLWDRLLAVGWGRSGMGAKLTKADRQMPAVLPEPWGTGMLFPNPCEPGMEPRAMHTKGTC